ncbi:MAG: hypothetical protein ACOZF0_04775 [Thermodesulfobacteriota bacterium]
MLECICGNIISGRLLFVNPGANTLLEADRRIIPGKTMQELGVFPLLCNLCSTAIEQVVAGGLEYRQEIQLPDQRWID